MEVKTMTKMFVTNMTANNKTVALTYAKRLFKEKGYTRLGFKPELKYIGRKYGLSNYEIFRVKE